MREGDEDPDDSRHAYDERLCFSERWESINDAYRER